MRTLTTLSMLAIGLSVTAQTNQIFIPNQGQLLSTDSTPVLRSYYAQVPGGTVYFDEDTVSFVRAIVDTVGVTDTLYRFDMRYINKYQYASDFAGSDTSDFYYNFYYPHCDTGITGVHLLGTLDVSNMWQGVDMSYTRCEGGYLTRFVVGPEWVWPPIRWTFDGDDSATIGVGGEMRIYTPFGVHMMPPPIAYSGNDTFTSAYVKTNGVFGLTQQGWSGLQPLVFEWGPYYVPPTGCEPGLEWSTYFGNEDVAWESGDDVAVDNDNGDVFLCGETNFPSIPYTVGPVYPYNPGSSEDDALLGKFDAGHELEWYTFYGGSDYDEAWSTAVGENSNGVYITGTTQSPDLVLRDSARYQNPAPGHGFVACFLKTDGHMIWGTYFGGTGYERFNKVIVTNEESEVYIGGYSESTDFPVRDGGGYFENNGQTGFIARFYNDTLAWSTKFGSPGKKTAILDMTHHGHAFDRRLYIVGETQEGDDFPELHPQGTFDNGGFGGGQWDGFIAGFDDGGAGTPNELWWCTYIGGDSPFLTDAPHERCSGISLHAPNTAGRIYVTGNTDCDESSFPLMRDTSSFGIPYYDSTFAHHPFLTQQGSRRFEADGFIAAFDEGQQVWTTYYGESKAELPRAIAIDHEGELTSNIYIAGDVFDEHLGPGTPLPTKQFSGMYEQAYTGDQDADDEREHEIFITAFDANNNHLWATFFGGHDRDHVSNYDYIGYHGDLSLTGHGLATYGNESLYLVGTTFSHQYPHPAYPNWWDFPLCLPPTGNPYFNNNSLPPTNIQDMPFIANFTIEPITGIDDREIVLGATTIWPNPASHNINVTQTNAGSSVLEICSLDGRIVMVEPMRHSTTVIDVSTLIPGFYILRIVAGHSVQSASIVIAHN